MNKALSAVKAAVNNNINVAISYSLGNGHVNEIMNMINGEDIKNLVLDCSMIDPTDIVMPSFHENKLLFSVSQEILDAEVIVIEQLSSEQTSESIQKYIDSMMKYRTISNVELPNLKSVVVLYSSFTEMMSAVGENEFTAPIMLSSF